MRTSAALLCALALPVAAAERPPNILFCISDDQSFPHASAYGTDWVRTPAFDRVAREGLLFTRAYTTNAKCAPSRAVLLTGRQSWQLEAAANHGGYYPAGYRTFIEALALQGYFVGFTGKGWAPGDPGRIDGHPRELTGRSYNERREPRVTTGTSPTDYAGNFAEFLAARPPGEPFCFWYGGYEPHRRYEVGSGQRLGGKDPATIDHVPAYWPDRPEVRQDLLDYALEIEHFDRHLGGMLEMLEAAGELDNTLVIVTSDNGMPFPRAKGTTYELSLHLPLAMRWPKGIADPGRTVSEYVNFTDIAPTLLAAAGRAAAEVGMEPFAGRSLLPVLHNELPDAGRRDWLVFGQERHDLGRPGDGGYPVRGCIEDGYLLVWNLTAERWPMGDPVTGYLNTDGSPTKTLILAENRRGLNHWRWQLAFGRRPAEELYHLERDPDCLDNLAGDPVHVGRIETMQERLVAELRRLEDPRVIEGADADFDRHPVASPNRNLYDRYVLSGERGFNLSWIEPTDFEAEEFDAERPHALRTLNPAFGGSD